MPEIFSHSLCVNQLKKCGYAYHWYIYTVFRLSFTFLMCYHNNTIKCYETIILPTNYKYMNIYFLNLLFAKHC